MAAKRWTTNRKTGRPKKGEEPQWEKPICTPSYPCEGCRKRVATNQMPKPQYIVVTRAGGIDWFGEDD